MKYRSESAIPTAVDDVSIAAVGMKSSETFLIFADAGTYKWATAHTSATTSIGMTASTSRFANRSREVRISRSMSE